MTARDSPSSMVKRSRDQSQEAPRRFSWLTIVPPECSFQAQTRFRNSSRPSSRRLGSCFSDQLPLDKALGCDARVVRPRLPKHVAPAHALEPRQHILQRVVQRMPHVKRTRHVWRGNHNRKGLGFGVDREHAPGAEGLRLLPGF